MDSVIKAMQFGAIDFLRKPFKFGDLELSLTRCSKFFVLKTEIEISKNHQSLITRELEGLIEREFIGISKKMEKILDLSLVAGRDNDINVLISGENGTGKEIIARIIHYSSGRKNKPFSPVNSMAIPETLLESEFFGHRKGAFTDAKEDKKGYFELANGGTLFLDEVADMPLTLQGKLLRAIEERQIRPVGSDKISNIDIRIICATNKNIEKLIADSKFRQDFFHRINTLTIHIPPLRERPEDIQPLVEYFVKYFAIKKNRPLPVVSNKDIKTLEKYTYPGNVRELRNIIERAFLISKNNELPLSECIGAFDDDVVHTPINFNLIENERAIIEKALIKVNFHQQKTADLLGISRDALIRKMKKYNLFISKNLKT
jgi:DNA-binding NtrC family response regulator